MAEVIRRVRPTYDDSYLGNPHKGCCTFQRFHGDPLYPTQHWAEEGPTEFPPLHAPFAAKGYLPSTVAYCRWYWRLLEPKQGEYDFSMIDESLRVCAERGQTLAVRLMAFGSFSNCQVPDWYAAKYPVVDCQRGAHALRLPVHDSPEYLEHWGTLIREFARRYDGHPLLESVDLAYIGPWGEGDGECSTEQMQRFTDLWRDAFAKTPRLVQIDGEQFPIGLASGAGWRCDCYGDVRCGAGRRDKGLVPRHLMWNHTFDCYPQRITKYGRDAWKTAPIHLETCGTPMHWYESGRDIDFIIEQGLKYHATYFMPKSVYLADQWIDRLAAFCRKLGYRFAYRQASFDVSVPLGGSFQFQSWIENVGVAPLYWPYQFALRLRQGEKEWIIDLPEVDVRTWLPGDTCLDLQIDLPDGVERGRADLAAGLIDPETKQGKVHFAAKERFNDGWVCLDSLEIT